MHGFLLALALIFGSTLHASMPIVDANPIHEAIVLPIRDIGPPAIVSRMPPSPQQEIIPEQPFRDAIWIPGYWAWVDAKADFAWVCGVWRRPPPSHQWILGSWVQFQGGWAWQCGFWSAVPVEQLAYIAKSPPKSIDDIIPQVPGTNYFWIRGYWEYSQNNYKWLSGRWEIFNPDWVMNPAQYVWRASGYVFLPMRWDFPLDARGNAYSCAGIGAPLVIIEPGIIINQLYCWFPDYIDIFCHWHFIHPEFWDDCDCAPPWWNWGPWWTFPWGDTWGLWWWWCHPGAFPPFWLSLDLSLLIAPPPPDIILVLNKMKKPPFDVRLGSQPFLPRGPENGAEPPRPQIPNDVTPGGQVTPPSLPGGSGGTVQPPPPPPPPSNQGMPTGPTYPPQYNEPDYYPPNYVPETYYPPRDRRPPDYVPPRDRRPPDYVPPRDRRPPDYVPPRGDRRPDYTPPPRVRPEQTPPSRTPPRGPNYPNYTPPSNRGPNYPNYTPPSNKGSGVTQPRGNFNTQPNVNPGRNFPQMTPRQSDQRQRGSSLKG